MFHKIDKKKQNIQSACREAKETNAMFAFEFNSRETKGLATSPDPNQQLGIEGSGLGVKRDTPCNPL